MLTYRVVTLALCLGLPAALASDQLTFSAATPPAADSLVRFSFATRAHAEAAASWMDEHEIDVWSTKPSDITARFSKQQQDDLEASPVAPLAVEVLLPSIQQHLDSPTLKPSFNALHSEAAIGNLSMTRLAQLDDPIHDSYHSLENLNQLLRSFEEQFPGYAKVVSVGFSSEGREIWGLKGQFGARFWLPIACD